MRVAANMSHNDCRLDFLTETNRSKKRCEHLPLESYGLTSPKEFANKNRVTRPEKSLSDLRRSIDINSSQIGVGIRRIGFFAEQQLIHLSFYS